MDLRRDRKRLVNFREMLETQGTNEPGMQKRGDKNKPSQREGTHFKMCVINVRSLVSSHCWSWPLCPNLIGSVNLNQLSGKYMVDYLHISPNCHYTLSSISKSHGSSKHNFTPLISSHQITFNKKLIQIKTTFLREQRSKYTRMTFDLNFMGYTWWLYQMKENL